MKNSGRLATNQNLVEIKEIEEFLPHPITLHEGSFSMPDMVGIQTPL